MFRVLVTSIAKGASLWRDGLELAGAGLITAAALDAFGVAAALFVGGVLALAYSSFGARR